MALRTPTPLKSTDLQLGQREENTPYSSSFSPPAHLAVRFCGASSIGGEVMLERSPGGGDLRLVATAAIGTARFPGCFDLFRRPDVRLGKFNVFFGAGNLALVPLR